ncbi:MAG: threonine synthase, partial [Pseudonocardiaceae bacterium]
MTGTLETRTTTALDLGPACQLVCRECGCSTPLAAEFACAECFGPLEVGYDFGHVTRTDIEAGPSSIWRYRGLLPVPDGVDEHPNTQPGLTRLIRADRLA